ncbi:MAG: hypothetical protein SV108_00755 [Pseudomonadota bacterium]|nr:hypothetical protein [Pseudomonadota bacterium]
MAEHRLGWGYERRDVPWWVAAASAAGVLVLIGLVLWGLAALFGHLREGPWTPQPAPFAATADADWPDPQLQAAPAAELARLRQASARRLDSFGWVEREAGLAHIPIELAMLLLVQAPAAVADSGIALDVPAAPASAAGAGRAGEAP